MADYPTQDQITLALLYRAVSERHPHWSHDQNDDLTRALFDAMQQWEQAVTGA